MTLRRIHFLVYIVIVHVCLQGSSRKGQQFGVTASGTCIDSHQQTKCTQFNLDGLPCLQFLIACSMGSKTGGREDLGMRLVLTSPNEMY